VPSVLRPAAQAVRLGGRGVQGQRLLPQRQPRKRQEYVGQLVQRVGQEQRVDWLVIVLRLVLLLWCVVFVGQLRLLVQLELVELRFVGRQELEFEQQLLRPRRRQLLNEVIHRPGRRRGWKTVAAT
jgi:hypothetical protein